MKKFYSIIPLIIFLVLIIQEYNFAIPAFARKYGLSCQTCHSPFPKLKPYGDTFAADGFTLADKDAPRYFVNTGDEGLNLLREIPIALRLEGFATLNLKNSEKFDFTAPYILKLMSGGEITKDVSYYFYFFFGERGEVAGIEDAFIMFNNIFNKELDLYVGQFQVSDPLFKRELRLTLEDYSIYKAKPGFSKASLAYDRGIMVTYGLETGTDLIFEVLNGSGIGPANNFTIYDDDSYKNYFGRISQDLSDWLRVGAFGYFGKEDLEDDLSNKFTNSFSMWGADITLSYKDRLELNFQYGKRIDDKPSLLAKDLNTKGFFGELIFTPLGDESKWYGVGMYNKVESDDAGLNYESATFSLGYLLRRNIRLVSEFTYNIDKKFGQFSVGFVSSF